MSAFLVPGDLFDECVRRGITDAWRCRNDYDSEEGVDADTGDVWDGKYRLGITTQVPGSYGPYTLAEIQKVPRSRFESKVENPPSCEPHPTEIASPDATIMSFASNDANRWYDRSVLDMFDPADIIDEVPQVVPQKMLEQLAKVSQRVADGSIFFPEVSETLQTAGFDPAHGESCSVARRHLLAEGEREEVRRSEETLTREHLYGKFVDE